MDLRNGTKERHHFPIPSSPSPFINRIRMNPFNPSMVAQMQAGQAVGRGTLYEMNRKGLVAHCPLPNAEQIARINIKVQFFFHFPHQCLCQWLSLSALTAGKLPASRIGSAFMPLGNQDASLIIHHARSNDGYGRRRVEKMGTGLLDKFDRHVKRCVLCAWKMNKQARYPRSRGKGQTKGGERSVVCFVANKGTCIE